MNFPGVIHFDILHQILRSVLQQCNLMDVKVKVQEEKSMEIQKFTSSQKTSQLTLPSPEGTVVSNHMILPVAEQETHVEKSEVDIRSTLSKSKEKQAFDADRNSPKKTLSAKDTNVIGNELSNKPLEHTVSITAEKMQWIIDTVDSLQNQINEMKQLPNNQDIFESFREGNLSKSSSVTRTSQKTSDSTSSPKKPVSRILSDTPIVDMLQILTLTKRVDAAEESITKLGSLVEEIAREYAVGSKEPSFDIESLSELQGMPLASLGNKQAFELLAKEMKALKKLVYGEAEDLGPTGANLQAKMASLDVKMKNIMDQIESVDRLTAEQIGNLLGQYAGLEDAISRLENKMVDTVISQKAPLMALHERYNKIDEEMVQMRIDQKRVQDSSSKREMQMSAVIEQLEVLKTCKVNKEEFDEALDKKLDAERILTKVSQEKFDRVYDDLKLNIEDTIMKLTSQEEMWQKALLELQGELVTKLEKKELVVLQDFVKEKLKILRDKVKSMKYYQIEKEAAATKQMLMKNVKCLSCDTDVTTRTKQLPQDYPKSPSLPPNKTVAPYLIYELDVMRKQQRGMIHGRNMHHFEASVRNKGQRIENRYCGGPHTVTTPVQRVTRLGHFLEQWGPEVVSANENFVKGTDHKVYVGCTNERNKRPSIVVEGNILGEKKSHHEVITHIPEKDSGGLKQDLDIKSGIASISADLGKSSSVIPARKSTSRKSLDIPEEQIRKKISAFSFDDNPDVFPNL